MPVCQPPASCAAMGLNMSLVISRENLDYDHCQLEHSCTYNVQVSPVRNNSATRNIHWKSAHQGCEKLQEYKMTSQTDDALYTVEQL